MNFQGNFRDLGKLDISPIRDLVIQLTDDDWAREDTRQKRYEVHKDTQFIGIAYDEDFRHMQPTRRPAYELFGPVLHPLFVHVADYFETLPETLIKFDGPVQGYFIRVSLVKLLPGGRIDEHQDMNFSLAHSHRVHVPIITNDKVFFNVGSETRNLKTGEIVEINNRRKHSVRNDGEDGRVHLILDWVFPWEPCCCADKTHPEEPCTPDACLMTDRLKIPCDCYPVDPG